MKLKLIFSLMLCFAYLTSSATLRRVNNNPGVTLPAFGYTTFALAQTASAIGDTIYLEPSLINYGALIITKKLVIVGPGYLLDQNIGTPADKQSATCSSIIFDVGSTGSAIYGLRAHDGVDFKPISLVSNQSNLIVSRCIFLGVNHGNTFAANNIFSQNVITNNFYLSGSLMSGSVISNNIILGSFGGSTSGIVKNNLIYNVPVIDNNINYYNNIFIGNGLVSDTLKSQVAFNNVCVNCTGVASNNNFYTTAYNTIFTATEPRVIDDLEDARFQLATTSPAKTKGVGGVDCGPFGGINPYVLSGIPAFPSITAITVGAQVGANIPITFSAKRNN
jgi:hypothetical protein